MNTSNQLDGLRMKLAGGLLTAADVQGLSDDEVYSLKVSTPYRSTLAIVDEKASNANARTVVFDGSTEHQDRMGDIVRVHGRKGGRGWQVERYLDAGGPFLWAHDATAPPVGQASKVWKGKSSRDPSVNALKFRIGFEEDRDFPFANLVGKMYLSGRMKGSSVGFVVSKSERYGSAAERKKVGLGPNGVEVTESDLLELSGTPTPANAFALATNEKSDGVIAGIERAISEALDWLGAEGHVSKTQAREFRKRYPLGPTDAHERLRARVRGFVDFGGVVRDEPVDLTKSPEVSEPLVAALKAIDDFESRATKAEPVEERMAEGSIVRRDFDIANQHIEAARLEYDWVSRWCGCEVKNLADVEIGLSHFDAGSFLVGLDQALGEFRVHDTRSLTRQGQEVPPSYDAVQLSAAESRDFLASGINFLEGPQKLAVKYERTWGGYRLKFWAKRAEVRAAHEVINKASDWAEENHYRRGAAFSLKGKFLDRGDQAWNGVFLEPENREVIDRAISNIRTKGAAAANRGMIWQGPPGTGKTLSARVLMAQTDATLIWASSRDFAAMGSTGGVLAAFELARRFAPAIILFEDVDQSFNSWTFDLLKTEMDGLSKSTGVTTILTTNHPEALPKAIIDRPGRFHDVLEFGNPTAEARGAMFREWLPELSAQAALSAVEESDAMSGAHVFELCAFARSIMEQDALDADAAMERAIEKLKRQRELIGDHQKSLGVAFAGLQVSVKSADGVRSAGDDEEDDEEDEGEDYPRRTASGGLIVPKTHLDRFRAAAEALQATAADVDDFLDILEGGDGPAPKALPRPPVEKDSPSSLVEGINALVEEMRAARSVPPAADGGVAASEKDAERPTPGADGEAHTAADENVEGKSLQLAAQELLDDVRSKVSSMTPTNR